MTSLVQNDVTGTTDATVPLPSLVHNDVTAWYKMTSLVQLTPPSLCRHWYTMTSRVQNDVTGTTDVTGPLPSGSGGGGWLGSPGAGAALFTTAAETEGGERQTRHTAVAASGR